MQAENVRRWGWFVRLAWATYFIVLTALLWMPQPLIVVEGAPKILAVVRAIMPWAHLLSFFALATLTFWTGWPVPIGLAAAGLASYGALTEFGQFFVPGRTPEWSDWLQDLGGIVLGAAISGAVQRWQNVQKDSPTQKSPRHSAAQRQPLC